MRVARSRAWVELVAGLELGRGRHGRGRPPLLDRAVLQPRLGLRLRLDADLPRGFVRRELGGVRGRGRRPPRHFALVILRQHPGGLHAGRLAFLEILSV